MIDAVSALKMVADLVPVEAVTVMEPARSGLCAMTTDPPIWPRFAAVLRQHASFTESFTTLQKPQFNEQALSDGLCLAIATAETEIYANVIVTIGVVQAS